VRGCVCARAFGLWVNVVGGQDSGRIGVRTPSLVGTSSRLLFLLSGTATQTTSIVVVMTNGAPHGYGCFVSLHLRPNSISTPLHHGHVATTTTTHRAALLLRHRLTTMTHGHTCTHVAWVGQRGSCTHIRPALAGPDGDSSWREPHRQPLFTVETSCVCRHRKQSCYDEHGWAPCVGL
jgi:hypothetical protein